MEDTGPEEGCEEPTVIPGREKGAAGIQGTRVLLDRRLCPIHGPI